MSKNVGNTAQKIFWTRYNNLRNGGRQIISFYGTGGLGKTLLAEKLTDGFAAQKITDDLAIILGGLGRYDEDLSMETEARKLSEEIFGEKHPRTIDVMFNLADTLSALSRDKESVKLTEQDFNLREEILGDGHVKTLQAMSKLAERLQKIGRHEEERRSMREILRRGRYRQNCSAQKIYT